MKKFISIVGLALASFTSFAQWSYYTTNPVIAPNGIITATNRWIVNSITVYAPTSSIVMNFVDNNIATNWIPFFKPYTNVVPYTVSITNEEVSTTGQTNIWYDTGIIYSNVIVATGAFVLPTLASVVVPSGSSVTVTPNATTSRGLSWFGAAAMSNAVITIKYKPAW